VRHAAGGYRRVGVGKAVHQTTGRNCGAVRVQALLAQRRRWQGRVRADAPLVVRARYRQLERRRIT